MEKLGKNTKIDRHRKEMEGEICIYTLAHVFVCVSWGIKVPEAKPRVKKVGLENSQQLGKLQKTTEPKWRNFTSLSFLVNTWAEPKSLTDISVTQFDTERSTHTQSLQNWSGGNWNTCSIPLPSIHLRLFLMRACWTLFQVSPGKRLEWMQALFAHALRQFRVMFHVFEGREESSDLGKTHTRTESYMETPHRKTQAETVLLFIPRMT